MRISPRQVSFSIRWAEVGVWYFGLSRGAPYTLRLYSPVMDDYVRLCTSSVW
jgi:hypothetical protein